MTTAIQPSILLQLRALVNGRDSSTLSDVARGDSVNGVVADASYSCYEQSVLSMHPRFNSGFGASRLFAEAKRPSSMKVHALGELNPLEVSPEVTAHVAMLLQKHRVNGQYETALLLFRSLLPSGIPFEIGAKMYEGLREAEGGLEITIDAFNPNSSLRKEHGTILPAHLLRAPRSDRVAMCRDYSFLLLACLRAANIESYGLLERKHVAVIAMLEGKTYLLDAAQLMFQRTTDKPVSDHEMVVMYYFSKGYWFMNYGNDYEKALAAYVSAAMLAPDRRDILNDLAFLLSEMQHFDEAIQVYDAILDVDPLNRRALHNKRKTLYACSKSVGGQRLISSPQTSE